MTCPKFSNGLIVLLFIILEKSLTNFRTKREKLCYNKSKEQQRGDNMNYSTVSVRLTEEEKKDLEVFAKSCDLTMSQVIRKAVKEYIEKNKID